MVGYGNPKTLKVTSSFAVTSFGLDLDTIRSSFGFRFSEPYLGGRSCSLPHFAVASFKGKDLRYIIER